jgi:hypothetical protein
MSAPVLDLPAAPAGRTVRPSLLRAEARRFLSRRFIRLLLALGALGYVAALVVGSTQYARADAAALADAQNRLNEIVASNNGYHTECLAGRTEGPPGISPEEYCGPASTAVDYGPVENFIDKAPFGLATDGLTGAQGTVFATAALAFLLGATFIGAEWSGRSIVALLFWEPRRLRVMAAKLGVLVGATAVLAVLAQAAWYGGARFLAATRGTSVVPDGFWSDYLGIAGRGVFVVVAAALLGFGIANAVRHTAASLGVGFLYFAVIENMVRGLRPTWQPWLLTENAIAFVQHEKFTYWVYGGYTDDRGVYMDNGRELVITHTHAGLLLGAITAVVLAIGIVLFKRRDLN